MSPARVGPFEVVREVAEAPGALLLEARDPDGQLRLLQVARFRAPEQGEEDSRIEQERTLARRTADLIRDPDVTVHAHGGSDTDDGERLLFWALPMSGLKPLAGERLSTEALVDLGVRLSQRIADRHDGGQRDPLLSEHLIARAPSGRIVFFGVPLAIDRGWISHQMPPYRFAPEENGVPLKSGDLFRLGRVLDNLASEGVPPSLRAVIDRLLAPRDRFTSAQEVVAALEAIRFHVDPEVVMETERTDTLDPFGAASTSIPEIVDRATDPFMPSPDPAAAASEAVTTQEEPVTPIPTVPTVSLVDEVPDDIQTPSAVIASYTVGQPEALDVLAAAWKQPVLPSGESPWSEVVEARGTHQRARDRFEGFDHDIPSLSSAAARTVVEDSPVARPRPLEAKKIVTAVLFLLVVFGLFALLARQGETPTASVVQIASGNDVMVESDPPGATVIAENDGAVLGKTPLSFLVGRDSDATVYLALAGYEPIRMRLPERGTLEARLTPVGDGASCEVALKALGGSELAGVHFALVDGVGVIDRAAVVRAPGRGARIVSCDEPSRILELELATRGRIHVTSPAGLNAFLDGEPIGPVPASALAKGSFSHIRVESPDGMSEERLVPTDADVEISMPAPKPRKMPESDVREDEPVVELPITEAYDRAMQAFDAGKMRLAKKRFTSCLAHDPEDALCHRGLADLYRRLRSPQKAREHYLKYLELAPHAPDAEWVREVLNE